MPKAKKTRSKRFGNIIGSPFMAYEIWDELVHCGTSPEELQLLTLKELAAVEKEGNEAMADVKAAQLLLMKVIQRVKKSTFLKRSANHR